MGDGQNNDFCVPNDVGEIIGENRTVDPAIAADAFPP
jgi:hypothetical protein